MGDPNMMGPNMMGPNMNDRNMRGPHLSDQNMVDFNVGDRNMRGHSMDDRNMGPIMGDPNMRGPNMRDQRMDDRKMHGHNMEPFGSRGPRMDDHNMSGVPHMRNVEGRDRMHHRMEGPELMNERMPRDTMMEREGMGEQDWGADEARHMAEQTSRTDMAHQSADFGMAEQAVTAMLDQPDDSHTTHDDNYRQEDQVEWYENEGPYRESSVRKRKGQSRHKDPQVMQNNFRISSCQSLLL